jgi:hypothetical protein
MAERLTESDLPERRIVAFIDILGFRSHITSIFEGGNIELYATLQRALSLLKGHADAAPLGFALPSTARGTAFSDCIAMSDETTDSGATNLAWRVALLTAWLLQDGILCRGGVAIGRTLHTDRVILGEGLISAVDLESRAAVYPRILLTEEVAEFASTWPPLARMQRDFDGLPYLDPFFMLRQSPVPGQLPKSLWETPWDTEKFIRIGTHLRRLIAASRSSGSAKVGELAKQQWLLNKLHLAAREHLASDLDALLDSAST